MTSDAEQPAPQWTTRRWGAIRGGAVLASVIGVLVAALVPFDQGAGWVGQALTCSGIFGAVAAAIASLRMLAIPTRPSDDPYLRSSARPISEGSGSVRLLLGDLTRAGLTWVIGATIAAILVSLDEPMDPTLLFMPIFFGLVWVLGACVGTMIGVLVFYPVSILLAGRAAERSGRPFRRGWILGAAALLGLGLFGTSAIVAAILIDGELPDARTGESTRGQLEAMIAFGDLSVFSPAAQFWGWMARLSILAVVGVIAYAAYDGNRARAGRP